jgi:high-affinity K+ transport system ATPase subunit B
MILRCRPPRSNRTDPAIKVVPGDILLIEAGDTVPADARVIQSTALQTAEAALCRGGKFGAVAARSKQNRHTGEGRQ